MPPAPTGPTIRPSEIAARARRGPVAVVDLDALARNHAQILQRCGPAECAPVVKGDGYGLGMLTVARKMASLGAKLLFVARLEDGIALRRELPDISIAVLDGPPLEHLEEVEQQRLIPVLGELAAVRAWLSKPRRTRMMVHLDSGMNRLGLPLGEAATLASLLAGAPARSTAAYLTHLIGADDHDLELCRRQVERFRVATVGLPPAPLSIVNSAGLHLDGLPRGDIVRAGKALYGISPLAPGAANPMASVLAVCAPILQLREVEAGETVGYAGTWRATARRRLATLGIGYANGYLRSLSNRGVVAFGGFRAPVVGRVSMDSIVVDVTDVPEPALETGISEILGPMISIAELAELAGSNEHEMLITLGCGCARLQLGHIGPIP